MQTAVLQVVAFVAVVTAVGTPVAMVRLVAVMDMEVSEVVPMVAVLAAERLEGNTLAFRQGTRLDMSAGDWQCVLGS